MLKSSGALAAATMASRIFGMVREIVYTWFMGVGMVAGAFQLAFQIPNLFRRLLGEGALTASFIPIFKEKEKTSTEAEMWRVANAVISGLVMVASIIVVVAMVGITAVLTFGPYEKVQPAGFIAADIKDLSALTEKFKDHSNPAALFLWDKFSSTTRDEITHYTGSRAQSKVLKIALAQDLSRIIHSGAIYDPTRFAHIKLSPQARAHVSEQLGGEKLAAFNQMLIEDICQPEIANHLKETALMLRLLRIMFPYMLMICLTAIFMGMLNARGHFFIPASGALVMNLIMIASVFFLAPRMGETLEQRIFGLAFGVLIAGAAQALFQLPPLRKEGFRYHWVSPWRDETVRRVVRQMIPGTIGIAAFQINVLTTQGIAFWVDPSIVAKFNVAVRLMELPQGVFGISLATYLLPTLSGLVAEKRFDDFRKTLNQAIDHIVFLNLLAAVLLYFLAEPIIRLLFEHGKFGPEATPKVVSALIFLAPGLLAFSLVNILARAFYALGDTKTPMKISILCLGLNLFFGVMLVWQMKQGGLALANTMSAAVNVSLLFYTLKRKLGRLEFGALRQMLWPIFVAGIVASVVAWLVLAQWEIHLGHKGTTMRFGAVFVPMTLAALAYWLVALAFKVPPALEMGALMLERMSFGRKRQLR